MAIVYRILRYNRFRRYGLVVRRPRRFRRHPDNDPLRNMNEDDIWKRYRFRMETIYFILDLVRPRIISPTRRSNAVSPLVQLLAALRFYATGGFYQLIGDSLGLSTATVYRCIVNVSFALSALAKNYIKFPTYEVASRTKRLFYQIAGFPHILGCIDGTFIPIQAPTHNEADYVNRKGFHSLNVQMTCDATFRVTNCVAKWPGTYDGVILGDSAYPCRKFLMTPYLNADTLSKQNFNDALCRRRVLIEQTFGILKRRFACLHTGLRVPPEKAAHIVIACVVLHNIGIDNGDIIPFDADEIIDADANENLYKMSSMMAMYTETI